MDGFLQSNLQVSDEQLRSSSGTEDMTQRSKILWKPVLSKELCLQELKTERGKKNAALIALFFCNMFWHHWIRDRVWTVMGAEQNDGSERNTQYEMEYKSE